ncbi:hypothetical protein ATO6_06090 [Oceanicola sp. 22II-s10i]|uniref:hypothetical protein n=1 Tax=Oceanicola sp. 22II-s10i TaxID=1317116 RepID=UPI000B526552|nr:hypothetical protein [Oceanicola sp. 22II-s10i]OWU86386.1 hypothetical protein ATO6_06090 [Oceanicola sp. 22II-s10i]
MRWLALWLLALVPSGAAAMICPAAEGRQAFSQDGIRLEAGERQAIGFGPGLVLVFDPAPHGWSARVTDAARRDISGMSAPRFGVDPRDLAGWHFRNAANTGPNAGDVNAPQSARDIRFDPGLAGTAGVRPGEPADADAAPGRGLLVLRDVVLTPPEAGQRARMLTVTLDLCLTWPVPKSDAPEGATFLAGCGVDFGRWRLAQWPAPPVLTGQFGGGPAPDAVAIARDDSDAPALLLCLDGTRLSVAEDGAGLVPPGLLARAEAWRVVPADHGGFGYQGEPPWPDTDGAVIVLERIEKSMDLIYVSQGHWRGQRQFSLVTKEP